MKTHEVYRRLSRVGAFIRLSDVEKKYLIDVVQSMLAEELAYQVEELRLVLLANECGEDAVAGLRGSYHEALKLANRMPYPTVIVPVKLEKEL